MSALTESSLAQQVTTALVGLGESGQAVADRLLAGGHLGHPTICTACPIAAFLIATIPNLDMAYVAGDEVGVRSGAVYALDIPLPGAVSDFVRRFDTGAYPALIAERPDKSGRGAS
jgi:hypothetical protein